MRSERTSVAGSGRLRWERACLRHPFARLAAGCPDRALVRLVCAFLGRVQQRVRAITPFRVRDVVHMEAIATPSVRAWDQAHAGQPGSTASLAAWATSPEEARWWLQATCPDCACRRRGGDAAAVSPTTRRARRDLTRAGRATPRPSRCLVRPLHRERRRDAARSTPPTELRSGGAGGSPTWRCPRRGRPRRYRSRPRPTCRSSDKLLVPDDTDCG